MSGHLEPLEETDQKGNQLFRVGKDTYTWEHALREGWVSIKDRPAGDPDLGSGNVWHHNGVVIKKITSGDR